MSKIAVLVSGGVDSSVALALLKKNAVAEVHAFYLKIWLEDELQHLGNCPWEEDLSYVRTLCEDLNVPLQVISLQKAYHEKVVSYAVAELKAGRTPSPDIFCNQRIKFGAFWDEVANQGYDYIATGHYAQVEHHGDQSLLKRATDPVKDQTYFLSHLSQEQLQRCLFPIGAFEKKYVREMAKDFALPTAARKDSQGICFLGKIPYREFVGFHLGKNPGEIREWGSEKVLGSHEGYWFHTYGQRKGLRLGGGPWFVVEKDLDRNIVYVARDEDLPKISRHTFIATELNWFNGAPQISALTVKLRHGPKVIPCEIRALENGHYHITLAEADDGLAEGQFAVFYDDTLCLGGGKIHLQPITSSSETFAQRQLADSFSPKLEERVR